MNASVVGRHYRSLTPEERFRLIFAASGRGDEAERDRLANAGRRITFSASDYSPYAHAFDELALLIYIELLEEAASYLEALNWADDTHFLSDNGEDDEAESTDSPQGGSATGSVKDDPRERPVWKRALDLALATGFVLRTKTEGWKTFCQRLNVPPFLELQDLPGFDRLQRALATAEEVSFVSEGFLSWLNVIRPAGAPEVATVPLTVEGVAKPYGGFIPPACRMVGRVMGSASVLLRAGTLLYGQYGKPVRFPAFFHGSLTGGQ
jgi:hypothetical protein